MTQEDIIRIAREAGWKDLRNYDSEMLEFLVMGSFKDLERFAQLVASAEREACAISCEVNAARWIDARGKQWHAAHECATAIRARGQQ